MVEEKEVELGDRRVELNFAYWLRRSHVIVELKRSKLIGEGGVT